MCHSFVIRGVLRRHVDHMLEPFNLLQSGGEVAVAQTIVRCWRSRGNSDTVTRWASTLPPSPPGPQQNQLTQSEEVKEFQGLLHNRDKEPRPGRVAWDTQPCILIRPPIHLALDVMMMMKMKMTKIFKSHEETRPLTRYRFALCARGAKISTKEQTKGPRKLNSSNSIGQSSTEWCGRSKVTQFGSYKVKYLGWFAASLLTGYLECQWCWYSEELDLASENTLT